MEQFVHTIEIPLFCRISQHFRDFLTALGDPIFPQCGVYVRYWQQKLTFLANISGTTQRASLSPYTRDFSEKEIQEFEKELEQFFFKFHCSTILLSKGDATITIDIIHPSDEEYLGRKVPTKLKVTITCLSLAAELALHNFFAIVDQ